MHRVGDAHPLPPSNCAARPARTTTSFTCLRKCVSGKSSAGQVRGLMILTRDAPPRIIFTWTVSFEGFFETHLGLVFLIELFSDSSHLPTFELRQRSLCAGPARRRRSPVKTCERNRRHRHPVRRGGFDQYRTGATRPTQRDNPCRSNASSVEEIIPPTIIGTAMRCITSEPAPVLQRMGSRPAMIAAELQQVGREARQVPSSFIVRL
jgi:hypothetical protein